MKIFGIYMLTLLLVSSCVFVLGRNIQFKPWVKNGQEMQFQAARQALKTLHSPVSETARPKLHCQSTDVDFGVMNVGDVGTRHFTLTNIGSSALAVSDAGASCGCLTNDFGVFELQPGESRQLLLTWSPFERDEHFSKQQKIETNDPENPELFLTVRGVVHATLQASPGTVVIDRMIPGELARKSTFQIYSESFPALQVVRTEVHKLNATVELLDTHYDNARKRSVATFQVIANTPQQTGAGVIRVFLRIPTEQRTGNGENAAHASTGLDLQPDGTVLVEVPLHLETLRRLSLYSPLLETLRGAERKSSNAEAKVELGKVFQRDSSPRTWALVGRLRGSDRPERISVELTGIPSVTAYLEYGDKHDGRMGDSFRIVLESESKIPVGVYDREQAGVLRIETPGLIGEELMELPVTLDVLSDKERTP